MSELLPKEPCKPSIIKVFGDNGIHVGVIFGNAGCAKFCPMASASKADTEFWMTQNEHVNGHLGMVSKEPLDAGLERPIDTSRLFHQAAGRLLGSYCLGCELNTSEEVSEDILIERVPIN